MGIGTALISGAALFLMQAFPVNSVFWPALFVWFAVLRLNLRLPQNADLQASPLRNCHKFLSLYLRRNV